MEDDDEEDWLGEDEEDGEPQDPGASDAEFYDPDLDQRDEAWMTRQRGGRTSDAILSCPGCLTTVCLDCQQHQAVDGHYRAMFCMNVRCAFLGGCMARLGSPALCMTPCNTAGTLSSR